MKPRHMKRYQRDVGRRCRDIFDHSRKIDGLWSELKATVTISQDVLHSEMWNWRIHLHIDRPETERLRACSYPDNWHPIRGWSDSGQEADQDARAIIQHARTVYAELVTTIAPPTTITIEV